MSRTATYHTTVEWKGEHWGHIVMGNGPEMDFSAPPDAQGHEGVLTPEDAFVASVNTCVMMMFIWATERFKLDLYAVVAQVAFFGCLFLVVVFNGAVRTGVQAGLTTVTHLFVQDNDSAI